MIPQPRTIGWCAFALALLLAPPGCAFEREITHGVAPDAPVPPVGATARFFVARPAGEIAGDARAVVRLFRRDGTSFDHDHEFRFEREGEFLIEGLPPAEYDVEAFVDRNATREPEVGLDALGARLSTPFDAASIARISLRAGATTRVDVRLIDPVSGARPAAGETAVGSYAPFDWDPFPGAIAYDFRVRDEAGGDLYRVRVNAPRARYGETPAQGEGTVLKFPETLRVDTYYRWSVTALDAEGRAIGYLAPRRFMP